MFTGFSKVSIPNFKSLRSVEFSPRRVNVFIGDANSGKSNILEALAVFSEGVYEDNQTFKDILRFKTVSDLFYDRDLSESARVVADGVDWSIKRDPPHFTATYLGPPGKDGVKLHVTPVGEIQDGMRPTPRTKYYRFQPLANFTDMQVGGLHAPYGTNLAVLLETNKRLRHLADGLFQSKGFRLVVNSDTYELLMAKEQEGRLCLFNYPAVSETFRRIVFFMAILETNENSVLLLDEPETNTYPLYTADMAERVALDESNQYFLTTHNPYILGSIVGKTPVKDLAVFVTTMEGYRTRVAQVADEKLPLIFEYGQDAFLNLNHLLGE
jgi:hypothetical protein